MTQAPTPTVDTVRRLARSLLKDSGHGAGASAALDVRPAGDGADPTTWLVGTRYVLHLAPDRATGARRRRELRLREVVRPHVPVALPVCLAQGEWAPGLLCTLETRLVGGTAEENTVSAVGETDLAGLLTGLHQVPVRQAESLGVPRVPPRSLETLRRAAGEAVELLDKADEFEAARLRQFTQPATVQLAAQAGSAVLVHHALTGGDLVVGADGLLRGVLGWDSAVVGDPAEDIAGLARAVGAPAGVRAATLGGFGGQVGW
ncbi:aminoglycoside phosphotransferase family protein, partial [Streptomyces thermocarboxydus]|uniref:aminoglycoside phosphotransferase family protein n=1 Tax=Streptomyces thermocarboxydus TaxID=59299 RepID=UPI0031F8F788